MEFFNNNINDKLNFKINIEGIDINKIEPRLIIKNEKNNYIFFGKIKENICTFNIPELSFYTKGDKGEIKFEIISEDLYFPVWKDEFEIKTKKSVKIEELYQEIVSETKPKVTANAIFEKVESIVEEIIEEPIIKEKKIEDELTKSIKKNNIDDILKEQDKKEKELIDRMSSFVDKKEVKKTPIIKKFGEIK
jgi:hypothetical protein